jgi:uncharacterized membrane protein
MVLVGHYGMGMAAKYLLPHVSLGLLVLCNNLTDVLLPILALLGVERASVNKSKVGVLPYDLDFPYTHSLTGHFVLGLIVAALYFGCRSFMRTQTRGPQLDKDSFRNIAYESFMLGLLVFVHWFMDLPVRRGGSAGDGILLWFSEGNKASNRYGRGWFDSPLATILIEIVFFVPGYVVYKSITRRRTELPRPKDSLVAKLDLNHFVIALWVTHLIFILAPKVIYDNFVIPLMIVWIAVSAGLAILAHIVDHNRFTIIRDNHPQPSSTVPTKKEM